MNSIANSTYLELKFKLSIWYISGAVRLVYQQDGLAAVLVMDGKPEQWIQLACSYDIHKWGEINCNQQSADLDGEPNLRTKLLDLGFNDFYWCFVVLLFIVVKYFGRCGSEKQSMKSARLMRFWYSPKVVMDGNRNMTSSSLSSPVCFLILLQLLVILCIFKQMCIFPEKQKNWSWGYHLITSTHQQ